MLLLCRAQCIVHCALYTSRAQASAGEQGNIILVCYIASMLQVLRIHLSHHCTALHCTAPLHCTEALHSLHCNSLNASVLHCTSNALCHHYTAPPLHSPPLHCGTTAAVVPPYYCSSSSSTTTTSTASGELHSTAYNRAL